MDLRLMKCYPQVCWQQMNAVSLLSELFTHKLPSSPNCSLFRCIFDFLSSAYNSMRNCINKIHVCLIFFATLSLFGSTVKHQRKFCLQYKYVFHVSSDKYCLQCTMQNTKHKTDGWLALNVFRCSLRFGMTTSCDGCRRSLTELSSLEFHRTRSGDPTLCSTTSETVTIITIIINF